MRPQNNKISLTIFLICLLSFCCFLNGRAQNIGIGFYNLENLFDTIDDAQTIDEEFTPNGIKHWTTNLYQDKLQRLSRVINGMSGEIKSAPLALIGVCEIENQKVLEDLVNSENIRRNHYKMVHHHSPDLRGVDVALLYQPKYFTVLNSQSVHIPLFENDSTPRYTRDVLLVKGKLGKQLVFVLVNHWPSRRGGESSKPYRAIAAKINRQLADSITKVHHDASIIIMGDLNDNPDDESVKNIVFSKPELSGLKENEFYNPFYKNYKNGEGTTPFDDAWHLFDQILLSQNLTSGKSTLKYHSHKIYHKDYMMEKNGHFKNYPKRTFSGDRYNYGYSDHFPVMCYFKM
jgi:predicted extracellular nuclease